MNAIVLSRLTATERDNLEAGAVLHVSGLIRQFNTVHITGVNDFEKIFDHQASMLAAIFGYTADAWPLLESVEMADALFDRFANFESKLTDKKYNRQNVERITVAMNRLRRIISLKARSTYVTLEAFQTAMKCVSVVV